MRDRPHDILTATLKDVRPLANMLRALSFRNTATVLLHAGGMKLTVEEGRSIQANAYIQDNSFDSYEYTPPPPSTPTARDSTPNSEDDDQDLSSDGEHVVFQISLSTLLECLNIFGNAGGGGGAGGAGGSGGKWKRGGGGDGDDEETSGRWERREKERDDTNKKTSLGLTYAGTGEPLVLLLTESGSNNSSDIVTRCEITTYEPDVLMDLPFDDDTRVQKLIMKSEWLRDALAEIDPSSDRLTITFSPAEHVPTPYNRYATRGGDGGTEEGTPTFRLESTGDSGSTEMDYPNDRDVLEIFECDSLVQNSYKFGHVLLTLRALNASTKTSIRTAEDGLISFQFMIPLYKAKTGETKDGFVEFLCVALDQNGDY